MADRVGIVGVTQLKFEERKWKEHIAELLLQVRDDVMKQTGLEFKMDRTGIDGTVLASADHFSLGAGAHMTFSYITGGTMRPDERVRGDGAFGVFYGMAQILSGHHDIVLLASYCKESQVEKNVIENLGFDTSFQRRIGLDYVAASAMQARSYMHKYKVAPEQCARAVVKSWKNAKNNPNAQKSGDLTEDKVLKSPMVADPITQLWMKPTPSDGACALILATEAKAKKITDKPIWIKGIGTCYDYHNLGDRDLAESMALTTAAQRAYKMAGISDPLKQINIAEISEQYAHEEPMWYEGLGFCGKGEGAKLLASGKTELKGAFPVNPSGGVLSGLPQQVMGMHRVVECALQLRGEAGKRQVAGAKTALAHGYYGPAGQAHCVIILEK